jgi:actin-related protein
LAVEPPQFKTDPRYLSWIGGSVIPKLDSSKDMYVSREKYVAAFKNYNDHFEECKQETIKGV